MLYKKLLQPAIFILDKLSFKLKIIAVASTLFVFLIIPTYTLIENYYSQKALLDNLLDVPSDEFLSVYKYVPQIGTLFSNIDLGKSLSEIEKRKIISHSKKRLNERYLFLFLGFIVILMSVIYLLCAFYSTIADKLKLLEVASRDITNGKIDISLTANIKDEIGRAILSFNAMSRELNQNISFLNCYKMAIDETSIVSKTDKKGVITYVNNMFCEISGYTKQELIGSAHNIIRHPDMPKEAFADMWHTIQSKKIWRGVVKNRKKDGGSYIVDATVLPVLNEKNRIVEYVAVRHDITELEDNKEKLAKHKIDHLTKLSNKNGLLYDIQDIERPIFFYFNIDDFMRLNNLYGNRVGDRVLEHMAELLRSITCQEDCKLYRIYNDEFILICEDGKVNMNNYEEFFLEVINAIESSTMDCNAPECISFTVSGGVSYYGQDDNYENLSLYASIARNVAKLENKKFLLYSHDMQKEEDYAKNITWIKSIKKAISNNNFLPFFQPIMDNRTGKIVKYEALVRMIDERGKVISPFFFLEIAKKAKLYSHITRVMIDKTLEVFKEKPEYECSINLSTDDIMNEETRRYIYDRLESYPHPEKIVFEITESEEITDFRTVNLFIKKVREHDVKISIDDFGTGYANFEYILSLDIDYLKIDGSLIKNIDVDEESRIIVEAIIAFSKKLNTKTIVEFVHSEEVYHEVILLGADYSQGYYIGKPKAFLK